MNKVGWDALAISTILVFIAVALSWWRALGLGRSILWAGTRALVQLAAIGLLLQVILEPEVSIWWGWLWVAIMIFIAAFTIRWRTPAVPGIFGLSLAALIGTAALTLGVLFGLGVFALDLRSLISLSGLMIGNSMAVSVLVGRRLVDELSDKRDEIEARLALGASSAEAAQPYLRGSLRTALIPQIETTKIVGLIALPGAMTGLILAGVAPLDAVRVQTAVMYLVLGSVTTTATILALGIRRRLFSSDHRLLAPARTSE